MANRAQVQGARMKATPQMIADVCFEGLASVGVLDDIDEIVGSYLDDAGPERAREWLEEVLAVVEWCNQNTRDGQKINVAQLRKEAERVLAGE